MLRFSLFRMIGPLGLEDQPFGLRGAFAFGELEESPAISFGVLYWPAALK